MANLSRRDMLAATAALATVGTVAAQAEAGQHPDAELIVLGQRFEELAATHAAAQETNWTDEERFRAAVPPTPDALIKTERDAKLWLCGYFNVGRGYTHRDIQRLKNGLMRKAPTCEPATTDGDFSTNTEEIAHWKLSDEAAARAEEIVAAYEAYYEAFWRLNQEMCGASGEALSAAIEDLQPVMEAIRSLPVQTLAGVAVKAKLAKWEAHEWWEEDERDQDFDVRMVRRFIDEVIASGKDGEGRP